MENSENTLAHRDLWERQHKFSKEGDIEGSIRLFWKNEDEFTSFLKEAFEQMLTQMGKAEDKLRDAKQEPNLARCVLGAMKELKDIGVWTEEQNSTYNLATSALESYLKVEKKRAEYKATGKAYLAAYKEYKTVQGYLGGNLAVKSLEPLSGNINDPLKWYLTSSELIKLCKNAGIDLTFTTLRKYQALGLVPKPIRLGRYSQYSVLTVIRLAIIQKEKKQGVTLRDMKPTIEASLKAMLGIYEDIYPGDRNYIEQASVLMTRLTDLGAERFWQEINLAKAELPNWYREVMERSKKLEEEVK